MWCNFCKDQFFPCRRCKYPFPKETYTPSMWQHRFERGATCTSCEAARHLCCEVCLKEIDEEKCRCNQCGKLKGKTEYSASMWHHKASTDRTIICLQCEAKNIEGAKHPCNKCGQWKLQTEYSASMWNHKANTDRMIICLECEAQTPTFRCDICNISKPVGAFSASALSHSKTRNTRCYDCSNPPCMFRPKCTTCTKCRGTTCKETNCTKDIKTVPPEHLPASVEDVKTFACQRCIYVRCIVRLPDGTVCGKERRHNAKAKARRNQTDYTCGDCQTWLFSQATLRKDTVSRGSMR